MSMNTTGEALADYEKAVRMGKRSGGTLPSLDDLLKEKNINSIKEIPLGLVQIPADQIVGTKTAGRSSAFGGNFMPILKENTEFAAKWVDLYKAHLSEGIRDPIKAYEYMNKFYVEEGNKRVSVLKFFGAVSIPGNVIRIVPPRTDDKEIKIYYEFMDFYSLSGVNYIWFSQEGNFPKLQRLVGKRPDEIWSDDDKLNFSSIYTRFEAEYKALGGDRLPITTGDAFLYFIGLYDYHTLDEMTSAELKEQLSKTWPEFQLLTTDDSVALQMDPSDGTKEIKKNIFARLIPLSTPKLKVAFIHEKNAETSAWTYAHELGRMHLQQAFDDQVITSCFDNATEDNIDQLLEQAIGNGNNLIFTTAPPLLRASLKAAIDHPDVKILNCSLNTSHRYIRTYYARMYEAKFLMGAIAGAMSENGKIGYVADYPIYGMMANINAFALGAKMVNARARVYLKWSTLKDSQKPEEFFAANDVRYISGQDMIVPGEASRHFGLYRSDAWDPFNLAMPVWHWGKFYEQMIRSIMNGAWKHDDVGATKGLNYWWGMSAGIIDVICSGNLPIGTVRLVNLLKSTICKGDFNPFSGALYSQTGAVQQDPNRVLSPEEIITMDWLAENVEGFIPSIDQLIATARPVVALQGVDGPEI